MNQETINNAIICAKLIKDESMICTFMPAYYWLSQLHTELVIEKEITPFRALPREKMLVYWERVCKAIPDKPIWIKKLAAISLYVYDIIRETKN